MLEQLILPLIVAEVGEVLIEKNRSKKCKNTAADVVIIFLNGRLSIFMLVGNYFYFIFLSHRKIMEYSYSGFLSLNFLLFIHEELAVWCITKQTIEVNH